MACSSELSLHRVFRFYLPLALTSVLALAVYPMVTFFMGHARMSLESLAVLPVVNSLVFIFRAFGLAAQEVFIALAGDDWAGLATLKRFALWLALAATAGLSVIVWTPLAEVWFRDISGLDPQLGRFALLPARVLSPIPGMTVLLCFQRAMLVNLKLTGFISRATALEVTVAVMVLAVGVLVLDGVGVIVAALALLTGRAASNLLLLSPLRRLPAAP